TVAVSSGKLMGLTGDTASVERFDAKDTDSLDHWSRRRGEELAMANVSAARRASGSSWSGGFNPCLGSYAPYRGSYWPSAYALGPGSLGGAWTYNPWYGMITYMPCSGMLMSPYGYGFWSPYTVGRLYYGYYGGGGFFNRGGYGYGGGTPVRGVGAGAGRGFRGGPGAVARPPGGGGEGGAGHPRRPPPAPHPPPAPP